MHCHVTADDSQVVDAVMELLERVDKAQADLAQAQAQLADLRPT